MTSLSVQRADGLRQAYPDWIIWWSGAHWWAMRRNAGHALRADRLDDLAGLLAEAVAD